MIAATYTQGEGFSVSDVPRPSIGDDELLVRVMASAICGTDLRIIRSGQRKLRDGERVVLGHEFCGVIEQAGARVASLYPEGTRVGVAPNMGCGICAMCARGLPNMCPDYTAFGINIDGAHTEYVRIPHAAIAQGSVVRLPEGLSWRHAALIEPLSCAVNGNRSVHIGFGETVVIFGAGPIGLMHIALARLSGAGQVVAVDMQAHRLEQARQFGADVLLDPTQGDVQERILTLTEGRGADVIITACSVAKVQQQALDMLAPFGRVCFFGGLPKDASVVPLDTNLIHYKNLVATGMTGGSPADFRAAMALIAGGRIDLEGLISHCYTQPDWATAFETALSGEGVKIVITAPDAAD